MKLVLFEFIPKGQKLDLFESNKGVKLWFLTDFLKISNAVRTDASE
jgi:hypothetical protein